MTAKSLISIVTGFMSASMLLSQAGLAQTVPTTLRQEMPYSEARQILLNAAWQAVFSSPNREKYAPLDYIINELGYSEVEDCSGTGMGFCRFEFATADGRKLAVVTINNQRGQQPLLYCWWLEE
jgi:hypothetical protein